MSTIYNLVSLYKTDIMTESATREFLIDVLRKAFPQANIYTGQKRVVITDPSNPSLVYKIAYNNAGILDNINEVATSESLKGLVQMGQVNPDVLNCVALASLTPELDPFIIVQEFVQNFDDNQDFRNWLGNSDVVKNYSIAGSINNNQVFPIFCSRVPQHANDYRMLCEVMSSHFVPSDISIFKEPRNYGFKNGRLCLLDMGSVVPTFTNEFGQALYPRYGTSNDIMTYVTSLLDPNLNITNIQQMNPGTYRVVKSNYNYGNAVNESSFLMESDDAVFELYTKHQNSYEYNKLLLIYGKWFFPQVNISADGVASVVNNMNDYANECFKFLGIQVHPDVLFSMWKNYIYKRAAMYINLAPNVIRMGIFQNVPGGTVRMSFTDFTNVINAEYANKGINLPRNVLLVLSSILYIKQVALSTNDPVNAIYSLYHSSPDQFMQAFNQMTGEQNQNDIFLLYNSSIGNV